MTSVLVSLLLTARSCVRSRAALQFEVLALRHQLQVLERSRSPRVRLSRADRLLWVWLARVWDEWRGALVIVKTRATLCLLRLHLGKSRNSEHAIVVRSFYPALTERPQGLAELWRVEGRGIDPPHPARDDLRTRDDATFE